MLVSFPISGDNGPMNNNPSRRTAHGVRVIERAISPDGTPVIGLYLFMAYGQLLRSIRRGARFADIRPLAIGVPALLSAHPGLSQSELADLLGVERMTAGKQVAACIRAGLVTRHRSPHDSRKYVLNVTARAKKKLQQIAQRIPEHEDALFGRLSQRERAALHRILFKLIDDSRQ